MNNEEDKKAIELVKDESGGFVVTDEPQGVEKENLGGHPNARNLVLLAEGLARSNMWPHIKDKWEAMAVIQKGKELKLPGPCTSLDSIIPVKGNLTMRAYMMRALLERAGVEITVLEKNPEICRLRFEKPGKKPFEETFTHEDAERVKNRNTGKTLADGDNYQNWPEEMNYNRCLTKGGRVYDPMAWLGMYSYEEIDLDAEPYKEAEKYEKEIKEKIEKKKKKAAEKPEPEKKKASPREKTGKVEKTKQEGSDLKVSASKDRVIQEVPTSIEPGKGDPSQLTDQERIEIVKTDIMEDFTVRYGTQHKKENPEMPLKDYVKEKYRRFKLFLKWFQEKKNVEEGKQLCFVAVNEHGFLSLSEGNAANVEIMWKKKDFTLDNFFEWEKLPPEEEDDEPPF